MKGRRESNINVWFPFIYSQKWNCYFQIRVIHNILSPSSYTHISVRDLYISRICRLFCCRKICGPILGIYKSITDTWIWKLGLRPHNSQKRNTYLGLSLQCKKPVVNYNIYCTCQQWDFFPPSRAICSTPVYKCFFYFIIKKR
jgi:hypothetical protein